MDKYGFLDFKQISQTPFDIVLKALGIDYKIQNGKLMTDNEIISVKDNLFLYKNATGDRKGGSVIQYVSYVKNFSLRDAAFFIRSLTEAPPKEEIKIPVLTLTYHPYLQEIGIDERMCQALNVGFCEQKGIMAKRICFKVGEHYIGFSPEKKDWLFPKNFKRNTLWNIDNCDKELILITHDLFIALKLIAKGYPYTASFMGANPTEEQKEIIKRYEYVFVD